MLKRKNKITVASAKAKARRLQQKIAIDFSSITGIPCGKDELIESREMGQSGVDIKLIGEAHRLLNVAVEAKAQEKWNIHSFLAQAQINQLGFKDWALICKKSRKDPVVFISGDYFSKLINKKQPIINVITSKSWNIDKWISKKTDDKWYIAARRTEEQSITIIMNYKWYIELLSALARKRETKKKFRRK